MVANSSKLNYLLIALSQIGQLISIVHHPIVHPLPNNPPSFFFWSLIPVDPPLFIRFSLSFFFFDRIFYENSLDSPVIDNVFVIPQRAAGQREIRSAGKNDDRGKNRAPFPRGNHVEEAMDGAWNG